MRTKHQFKRISQQRGFLLVLAVLLIMVVGFIGTTIAYLLAGSATATLGFQQSEKALYIAEAGFEQTARLLLTPQLTGTNPRISCASVTGSASLTNVSVGNGTFTATTVASNPVYAFTTLSGAINNTVTTIPLTSTAGFAPAGRVVIDGEILNYGAISGNNLIAVQRGVNANFKSPHASGAAVSQFQCTVNVKGGIPNLSSPTYKREFTQAVQMQEAWAAGALTGNNFVFTRWNYPTANTWTSSPLTSPSSKANLNGIAMNSNADGWAVGNANPPNFTLLRWTGSSWSAATLAYSCASQDLNDVSTVDSNEAWAVGNTYRTNGNCSNKNGPQRYTILKWNGSSWSALTPATSPSIPADSPANEDLNAVHVIDTTQSGAGTLGFAVGVGGVILRYNGTSWTAMTSPTTNTLTSVYIVSANEAWAVGASGTIIKYNGTSWSTVSSPTATQLNDIHMVDATLSGSATAGWAVGNSGVAITYNGTSWSSQNTGSAQNMFGVGVFSTGNDAYAVGAAGTIRHWTGSAWVSVTSNVATQLNAIAVIAPQQYPYAWQEIYP